MFFDVKYFLKIKNMAAEIWTGLRNFGHPMFFMERKEKYITLALFMLV